MALSLKKGFPDLKKSCAGCSLPQKVSTNQNSVASSVCLLPKATLESHTVLSILPQERQTEGARSTEIFLQSFQGLAGALFLFLMKQLLKIRGYRFSINGKILLARNI